MVLQRESVCASRNINSVLFNITKIINSSNRHDIIRIKTFDFRLCISFIIRGEVANNVSCVNIPFAFCNNNCCSTSCRVRNSVCSSPYYSCCSDEEIACGFVANFWKNHISSVASCCGQIIWRAAVFSNLRQQNFHTLSHAHFISDNTNFGNTFNLRSDVILYYHILLASFRISRLVGDFPCDCCCADRERICYYLAVHNINRLFVRTRCGQFINAAIITDSRQLYRARPVARLNISKTFHIIFACNRRTDCVKNVYSMRASCRQFSAVCHGPDHSSETLRQCDFCVKIHKFNN